LKSSRHSRLGDIWEQHIFMQTLDPPRDATQIFLACFFVGNNQKDVSWPLVPKQAPDGKLIDASRLRYQTCRKIRDIWLVAALAPSLSWKVLVDNGILSCLDALVVGY
jgi:hypothetical protein